MTSDTESVTQTSCTAFIKQGKKRLRQRKPGSRPSELPEASDDYGFLSSRPRAGDPADYGGPQLRRARQAARAGVGEWRLPSADGSIGSSGSIPITMGSLADSGGAGSQCCSVDGIERPHARAACLGSRSVSPWSEMSIHIEAGDSPPQQPDYGRHFDAVETIGKYYCRERRSRSAGPVRRGAGAELTFYPHVRDACGAATAAAAASRSAASSKGRSKSECRAQKTTAAGAARAAPPLATPRRGGCDDDDDGGFATRQVGVSADRSSRSLSRRRDESAASSSRRRHTSKSREIIALYTRSSTPGAAPSRPSSCTRAGSAASTSTLVCGGSGCGAGGRADYGQRPQGGRATRSRSAAAPYRGSDLSAASAAGRRTVSPAGRPTAPRSKSQPRPLNRRGVHSSSLSCGSSGCGYDDSRPAGSHDELRQRMQCSDSLSESLRLWARSASRSTLSTPRGRRRSDQDSGGKRTPKPSYTAVLEMDKDVNARIEALLNHGNSVKPAHVRLMAIASYKPADGCWASEDEVSVEAGAVVVAKYKQCEWVYIVTPDGREGFMPYAYTKPIRDEAKDARRDDPQPPRAVSSAAAALRPVASASPKHRLNQSAQPAAARPRASPESPAPRPRQSLVARQPRTPFGAPDRRAPSDGASYDGGGGERVEAQVVSSAGSCHDSPAAVPAAVAIPEDQRHGLDRGRRPPPRSAGGSQMSRFWHHVWDTSSVASSDNDSVFYEAAYATIDFDEQSASGSERTASALSTPGRSAAAVAAADALASDYGNNAAFFSDSGISEPSSDVDVRQRRPAPTTRAKPGTAAAAVAAVANEYAAYAYAGWPAGGVAGVARQAEERFGGGGNSRRRARGEAPPRQRGAANRCGRLPSDVRDRARPAAVGGGAGLRASLCPEMTRDYDGPTATVVYDYDRENEDDVGARAGESVCVLNEDDPQWLWVQKRDGCEGFLPRDNVLFLPFKRSFRLDDRRLTTTVMAAV